MTDIETLKVQRKASIAATAGGAPARTTNQFFGVGPITDMTCDEADARRTRFEFESWLEANYRKFDDKGNDIGALTAAEIGRSMHRGYPADKILGDMMREIHRYFEFPKQNKMAVGLGGGHSGFTVCVMHMITANDPAQHVFVDTPRPESDAGKAGGFFRQSWGTQLIEMQRYAENGDEARIHFSGDEGAIPSADDLTAMGIKLFIGVGHETTGASTYSDQDVANLLEWIDRDPENHHAIIDATSMLGSMVWPQTVVREFMTKCCMFMPFQKAIGGISGYLICSFTPTALELIEANQKDPCWAIPRQLKIVVPQDPKMPLTGKKTVMLGPIYDPEADKMLGGIINTYSTLAFAETTFGLLRAEKMVGSVSQLNARSIANRDAVNRWADEHPLFELGVKTIDRRGAAVTLLGVKDPDITDAGEHAAIIAKAKQVLAYDGVTHSNGQYERGLDVARYVNAFPGTPGDFRAWIGGIRPADDIPALLDNLEYAYHRAKIVFLEEKLAAEGVTFDAPADASARARKDDPNKAYKVLVCDLVGLKFDAGGNPDYSEVRAYVEDKGGVFHDGPADDGASYDVGKIHFFYQPNLSTRDELLPITGNGQYDGVIAAATFLPPESQFAAGGVRIGAGTGNMACACWGGGDGTGGSAPLMNTPSFNSRATAHMAIKALLKVTPDLPVATMHDMVCAGDFDTGKQLKDFPTEKLEGKRLAVIGFGNIGREVARIAQSFGIKVAVYARPRHKEWIVSEGFEYADSMEAAAEGADFLSPHTGLGALVDGKFANAGIVDANIINRMNDGAIIINYDRGEVINADDLDAALASGKIRYAAIDADLFKDAETGELSGPMVPYLPLIEKHPGKLELLPHAAADTEHLSRVEGARQAVDQLFDAIQYKSIMNLKGDLPEGYSNAGAKTVNGVGKVTLGGLNSAACDGDCCGELRGLAEEMAALWAAINATDDPNRRADLIARYGADLVKASNRYASLMDSLGLKGPYG